MDTDNNYSSLSLTTNSVVSERSRLFVNTNGTCFLCLHANSTLSNGFYSTSSNGDGLGGYSFGGGDEDTGFEEADEGKVDDELKFCHWNIFRYFNITPISIAKLLKGKGGESLLREGGYDEDEVDFSVLICGNCSEVAIKMTKLCEKLERIQMKVDQCVEAMQDIMAFSDKDLVLVHQFQKRMKEQDNGGQDKIGLGKLLRAKNVADFLRKTTKQKCFVRLKSIKKTKYKLSRRRLEGGDEGHRPAVRNEKISGEDVSLKEGVVEMYDEELVPVPTSSSASAFTLEPPQGTEWITDVPEVAEEISIGLTSTTDNIFEEEFIEQIPSSPQQHLSTATISVVEPSVSDDILHTTSLLPLSCIPPPPPIVTVKICPSSPISLPVLPPPPKAKPKSQIKLKVEKNGSFPLVPKRVDIPFDFYFHKKSDQRHLCPFCTESGSTLTNIRFHVIRLHPEKLFSPSRLPRFPVQDFKGLCESALAAITKEAETGERNATGTKHIVNCKYCPGTPKTYNDKRAFLCHMILNHYPVIRRKIMELQKEQGYVTDNEQPMTMMIPPPLPLAIPVPHVVATTPPPPSTSGTNSNVVAKKKNKRNSSEYKLNSQSSGSPSSTSSSSSTKKKKTAVDASAAAAAEVVKGPDNKDVFTIPGKFDCDLCGKHLSSSTSKWRHKARYCNVAKELRDQQLLAEHDEQEEAATHHHHGLLNGSYCDTNTSSNYLLHDEMNGVGMDHDDHDHLSSSSHDGKIEMEMMMMFQEANEDMMKIDGEDGEEENEQFLSDFQEFYDENEVNDVLLTMTMDSVPTEDPLRI